MPLPEVWCGNTDVTGERESGLVATALVASEPGEDGRPELLVDFEKWHGGVKLVGVHARIGPQTCRSLAKWLERMAAWAEQQQNRSET